MRHKLNLWQPQSAEKMFYFSEKIFDTYFGSAEKPQCFVNYHFQYLFLYQQTKKQQLHTRLFIQQTDIC